MNKDIKYIVSSDVDYEFLICEVYIDGKSVIIISKENKEFEFEIIEDIRGTLFERSEINRILETGEEILASKLGIIKE